MKKTLKYQLTIQTTSNRGRAYLLKILDDGKACEIVFETEEQAQVMIDILQKYGTNVG